MANQTYSELVNFNSFLLYLVNRLKAQNFIEAEFDKALDDFESDNFAEVLRYYLDPDNTINGSGALQISGAVKICNKLAPLFFARESLTVRDAIQSYALSKKTAESIVDKFISKIPTKLYAVYTGELRKLKSDAEYRVLFYDSPKAYKSLTFTMCGGGGGGGGAAAVVASKGATAYAKSGRGQDGENTTLFIDGEEKKSAPGGKGGDGIPVSISNKNLNADSGKDGGTAFAVSETLNSVQNGCLLKFHVGLGGCGGGACSNLNMDNDDTHAYGYGYEPYKDTVEQRNGIGVRFEDANDSCAGGGGGGGGRREFGYGQQNSSRNTKYDGESGLKFTTSLCGDYASGGKRDYVDHNVRAYEGGDGGSNFMSGGWFAGCGGERGYGSKTNLETQKNSGGHCEAEGGGGGAQGYFYGFFGVGVYKDTDTCEGNINVVSGDRCLFLCKKY